MKTGQKLHKRALSALLSLLILLSTISVPAHAAGNIPALTTVPSVQSSTTTGDAFTLTQSSRFYLICDAAPSAELLQTAQLLNSEFAAKQIPTSSVLPIVYGPQSQSMAGDLVLSLNPDESIQQGGYSIVTSDRITITASTAAGLMYGGRTVLTTMVVSNSSMPTGTITDYPDGGSRAMHLDAGRKYFSKDWIIALIKELSWLRYNQLQLHFSENEGFRFALNDMTLDVDGDGTAETNISGILSSQHLTQTDMDEIIAVAKQYQIEIVPAFDTPGHMAAILSAFPQYRWQAPAGTSASALDLWNSEAVRFSQSLIEKYVSYFASKGCHYFHIGGDEYANDVYSSGGMGFSALVSQGKYSAYVNYINEVAAIVKSYGMTPRAWNDGLYYNNSSLAIDKSVQITYWSSGWGGYNVASASSLAAKGHGMINTNGDYYYVLGKNSVTAQNAYNYSLTGFMGSTIASPVGGMFAVWCDYPNAQTQTQVASGIYGTIRSIGERLWNKDDSTSYSAFVSKYQSIGNVPGGFMSSGALEGTVLPTPATPIPAKSGGIVIISYVDDIGETIRTDSSLTGEVGESFLATPPAIAGYIAPDAVSGTFTDETISVTLVYTLNTDKSALAAELAVIVPQGSYSDATYEVYLNAVEAGQQVMSNARATQAAVDLALADLLAAKAALAEKPVEPAEISITSSYSFYSTYYLQNAIDGSTSTFAWTDSAQRDGQWFRLAFDDIYLIDGVSVSTYNTTARNDYLRAANVQVSTDGSSWTTIGTIQGSASSAPLTVTLEEPVEAKYVRILLAQTSNYWLTINEISCSFAAAQQTGHVTVVYVDDAGVSLRDSRSLSGTVGSAFTVTPEAISGYVTPEAVSGTFTTETQTVTLVYVLNTDKTALYAELNNVVPQGSYTDDSYAAYTDALAAGQLVADDARALQAQVDSAVAAIASAKAGLTLKTGYVTVVYVDDAGVSLRDSRSLSGTVGSAFTVTPETISGYVTPEAVSGTFTAETQTVTLVYVLNTDKTALYAELNNVVPQGSYTDDSYAAYTDALAAGQLVADDARALQTQVDSAVAAIASAKAGLKEAASVIVVAPESMSISSNKGYYSNYSYDRAIDGNTSSFVWMETAQSSGSYLRVDFGGYYTLNRVDVICNHATDYIRNANVQVSLDGNSWTTIGTISGTANNTDALTVSLDEYVDARYVQVVLTSNSNYWWIVNEISFGFGPASTCTEPEVTGYILDADGIDSGAEYLIKAYSTDKLLKASGTSVSTSSTAVDGDMIAEADDAAKWVIRAEGSGYTIQNLDSGKYLSLYTSSSGWRRTVSLRLSTSPTVFYAQTNGDYVRFYAPSGYYYYYLYYTGSTFSVRSSSSNAYVMLYQKAY